MPITNAVVGRQPVVDRDRRIVGYELLFRAVEASDTAQGADDAASLDGDAMTDTVILSALSLGLERLVGAATLFFNADRGLLTGQRQIVLPPSRTVVEVLESVDIDDEVLAGCRRLADAGFRLAADDFTWFDGAERLLPAVDIVKVDLQLNRPAELPQLVQRCRRFDVQLLAEKVETEEEFELCRNLGFEYFQGYLLGRPANLSGRVVEPTLAGVARLAAEMMSEDLDYARIEEVLRTEPALTYRLLQLAAIGRLGETRRTIRTIREALVTLGLNRIRGWLPVLLLMPAGQAIDSALPSVLARARLAELLADHLYPANASFAFTAGMLSAFDRLLDVPFDLLPELLEIPDDLHEAVFAGTSSVGMLIRRVIDYEEERPTTIDLPGLTDAVLNNAAALAFAWAIRATGIIDDQQPV